MPLRHSSCSSADSLQNAICIHEEDAGLLWRHWAFRSNNVEPQLLSNVVNAFVRPGPLPGSAHKSGLSAGEIESVA
ncbi:copper amine oxidase [Bradyrhizobium sp. PUT101]|uniref:copper amine oxidase n=1 Tax=Bradyrhizobium sp. PUT101 TaxID=3447427 RepID=UPI003F84E633